MAWAEGSVGCSSRANTRKNENGLGVVEASLTKDTEFRLENQKKKKIKKSRLSVLDIPGFADEFSDESAAEREHLRVALQLDTLAGQAVASHEPMSLLMQR